MTEPTVAAVEALVSSIEARFLAASLRPRRSPRDSGRGSDGHQPGESGGRAGSGRCSGRGSAGAHRDHPAATARTAPAAAHSAAGARRLSPARAGALTERHEWERLVADEARRQRRYGRPSAIVLLELEGVQAVTGHTGRKVIERIAASCGDALVSVARASDRITRLDDARFAVLLREAGETGAVRFAARASATCDPWLDTLPWSIRLLVGWTTGDALADLTDGIGVAERRLRADPRSRGDAAG